MPTLMTRPELAGLDPRWRAVRDRFLAAIDAQLRPTVARLLHHPHEGGLGLRLWLGALAAQDGTLPAAIPAELIRVYLHDPEAVPEHDCADCGLAVPVRPGREYGHEEEPERTYFDRCPCCGGRTGRYAYFANPRRYAPGQGRGGPVRECPSAG